MSRKLFSFNNIFLVLTPFLNGKFAVNNEFNEVYYSKPLIHENNGSTSLMTPHQARLRNLTYSKISIIFIGKNQKRNVTMQKNHIISRN